MGLMKTLFDFDICRTNMSTQNVQYDILGLVRPVKLALRLGMFLLSALVVVLYFFACPLSFGPHNFRSRRISTAPPYKQAGHNERPSTPKAKAKQKAPTARTEK